MIRKFFEELVRKPIEVKRSVIETPNLPSDFGDLRIAIVSDIHAGALDVSLNVVEDLVDKVNQEKADLVLFGGDYTIYGAGHGGSIKVDKKSLARILSETRSKYGSYGVMGNHDWEHGEKEGFEMMQALSDNQIHILENDAASFYVEPDHHKIWISGLGCIAFRRACLKSAFQKVAGSDPVILLTHNPRTFEDYDGRNVALMVAGHTHGGQIRLTGRFLNLAGLPTLRLPRVRNKQFFYGISMHKKGPVIVSQGIGTSKIPLRILCPPQIDIVTLKPAIGGA
ncbi:MAG TPA: metallophosphoesterase [Micavibrio sp.]